MKWVYMDWRTTDAAFNLAAEEYVFEKLPGNCSYFLLWQNKNAVIVGKHQNTYNEVNEEFVRTHGISVVRRLSGGGAVYHDMGNLNYTIITEEQRKGAEDFSKYCKMIADALREMGLPAEISGRNDILLEGKKISGTARYQKGGRIMHHGTLLFDTDLEVLGQALHADPVKLQKRGISSVKSRVTNIREYLQQDMSVSEFREMLLENIVKRYQGQTYSFDENDICEIHNLCQNRYECREWNYGKKQESTLVKKAYIDHCGLVELNMLLKNDIIQKFHISGDFFEGEPLRQVERRLEGCRLERGTCEEVLADILMETYILGLTKEQFLALMV